MTSTHKNAPFQKIFDIPRPFFLFDFVCFLLLDSQILHKIYELKVGTSFETFDSSIETPYLISRGRGDLRSKPAYLRTGLKSATQTYRLDKKNYHRDFLTIGGFLIKIETQMSKLITYG